jgi:hypothetical protein
MKREILSWNKNTKTNNYSDGMQCPESQVVGNYTMIRDTDDPDDPDTVVQVENSAYVLFVKGEYDRLNS